jgi:cell division protein DivIC
LQTQINDENERSKEIEKLEAYSQTKRYIEDIAREQLGLVYEDEIIIREDGEK